MAQDKFGGSLRKDMDVNSKAKNHWDTPVVEPGATRTKAESESNSVSQHMTGSGKKGSNWGGMPSNE